MTESLKLYYVGELRGTLAKGQTQGLFRTFSSVCSSA